MFLDITLKQSLFVLFLVIQYDKIHENWKKKKNEIPSSLERISCKFQKNYMYLKELTCIQNSGV